MNFNQLVTITAPEYRRQPEERLCPDQFLGPLSQVIDRPDFPLREMVHARPGSACLIMVLESPHTDEFIGDLGPAKGKTGQLLRLHLAKAIDSSRVQDMGLILVNAIQYQCSLGKSTKLYRDKIFRAMWAIGGQEDFTLRLLTTFKEGDILMNCCTKGNDFKVHSPLPLRNLVEATIKEALPKEQSIKRMHPSSWWKAIRRSQEWQ